MISDVLSDAHASIRSYLADPIYAEMYSGELREEIEGVLAAIESLRQKLDRPPAQAEQPNSR
jgi:hypothetical protein